MCEHSRSVLLHGRQGLWSSSLVRGSFTSIPTLVYIPCLESVVSEGALSAVASESIEELEGIRV